MLFPLLSATRINVRKSWVVRFFFRVLMNGPPLHIGVTLLFTRPDGPAEAQDDIERLFPEGNSDIENALLKIAREPKEKQPKIVKRLFEAQGELSVGNFAEEEPFIQKDNISEVIGNLSMSDIVALAMTPSYSRRTAAPFTCQFENCDFECTKHNDIVEHYTNVHGSDPPTSCFETPEVTFENMTGCTCDHVRTVGVDARHYCRRCNKLFATDDEYQTHFGEHMIADEGELISPFFSHLFELITRMDRVPLVKEFFPDTMIGIFDTTTPIPERRFVAVVGNDNIESIDAEFPRVEAVDHNEDNDRAQLVFSTTVPVHYMFENQESSLLGCLSSHIVEGSDLSQRIPGVNEAGNHINVDPMFTERLLETNGDVDEENDEADNVGEGTLITQEDYENFKAYIGDELINITNVQQLREFVDKLNGTRFADNTLNDDSPLFFHLLQVCGELPAEGLRCPFHDCIDGNDKVYSNNQELNRHIKKEIKSKFPDTPCLQLAPSWIMYYWPVINPGMFIETIDGTAHPTLHVHRCPYIHCDYVSSNLQSCNSHAASKIHGDKDITTFGPFWGPIIEAAKHDMIIDKGTIMSIKAVKCPKEGCTCIFSSEEAVRQHIIGIHHEQVVPGQNLHGGDAYINFVEGNVIQDMLNGVSHERDVARETELNETIQQERTEAIQQQQQHENDPQLQQAREDTVIDQGHTEGANRQDEMPMFPPITEQDNIHLIDQANEWIRTYKEKELRGFDIPPLTKDIRYKVISGLKTLYSTQIIPLMQRYSPLNDSEEECAKIDGVIYRINHIFREHICSKLNIRQKFIGSRTEESNDHHQHMNEDSDVQQQHQVNQDEDVPQQQQQQQVNQDAEVQQQQQQQQVNQDAEVQQQQQQQQVNQDAEVQQQQQQQQANQEAHPDTIDNPNAQHCKTETLMIIERIYKARNIIPNDQSTEREINEYNRVVTKIVELCRYKTNEFTDEVFGGRTFASIDAVIKMEDDSEFNKRINWLRSQLDIQSKSTKNDVKRLRTMFEDNPRKALEWYVFNERKQECRLTADAFAQHYGTEWAQEPPGYNRFIDQEDWHVDKVFDDEFNNTFVDYLTDKKKISEIVRNKNFLSAHGLDGISNCLFRSCPEQSSKFLSLLFAAIMKTKHMPQSWMTSKTVMLYKKGDPDVPKNWRPIGITSTMYRVFMTAFAKALQRKPMFNTAQKGFTPGASLTEHIAVANEIMNEAVRKNGSMFETTIDLVNAFGSVPHSLIFEVLEAKGLSHDIIQVIANLYQEAATTICTKTGHTDCIPIRKGVIQGCPLSPILFNCCIDPLLYALERRHSDLGFIFEHQDRRHSFNVQAYADDVILISTSEAGMQSLLDTVNEYQDLARLRVAPQKCCVLFKSSAPVGDFHIGEQVIPKKLSNDTTMYLGAPITSKKSSRIGSATGLLESVKAKMGMIFSSNLTLNQMIVATRAYILPQLDFTLSNGMFAVNDLKKVDQMLRGYIDTASCASKLPISYFYTSTSHGGLGLYSLEERQPQLQVTRLFKLLYSNDEKIRDFIKTMINEERRYRHMEPDDESQFMGVCFDENDVIMQGSEHGTNSIFIQAARAARKLQLAVQAGNNTLSLRGIGDEATNWHIAKTPKTISKIIGTVLKERTYIKLRRDKKHSMALQKTNVLESHVIMSKPWIVNNNLYKIALAMRTDTFPTPLNVHYWKPEVNPKCTMCNDNKDASLKHILNTCTATRNGQKWRHNLVVDRLGSALKMRFPGMKITFSCQVSGAGIVPEGVLLDEEVRRCLPDIVVYDTVGKHVYILEVNCPYGESTQKAESAGQTILDAYRVKKQKYEALRQETETKFGMKCTTHVIVVSSLGIIPDDTKRDILQIFNKEWTKDLLERFSMDVIAGSAVILTGKPPEYYGLICRSKPPVRGDQMQQDAITHLEKSQNHRVNFNP